MKIIKAPEGITHASSTFGMVSYTDYRQKTWLGETHCFPANEVKATLLDEHNYKAVLGTVGWSVAGTLALGGLGLIAGALLGGNKKNVIVALECPDDTKLIVEMPKTKYYKLWG